MSILQAVVLGMVQGLTEFIPVSSSGHLVLVPHLLGWHVDPTQAFIFDVLVQWGTLMAVLIYYRSDLVRIGLALVRGLVSGKVAADPDARLGWLLILATGPAVVAGLLAKDLVEAAFASARATGGFLLLTALLLVVAELVGNRERRLEKLSWPDAFWIGCAQVLALLPGVSRSGSTIAGGMLRNLDRPAAARFSFLMSVPVMLGAGVLALKDLAALEGQASLLPPLLVGFLVALVSGYGAIRWLIRYLSGHSLYLFALYCLAAGLLVIVTG